MPTGKLFLFSDSLTDVNTLYSLPLFIVLFARLKGIFIKVILPMTRQREAAHTFMVMNTNRTFTMGSGNVIRNMVVAFIPGVETQLKDIGRRILSLA